MLGQRAVILGFGSSPDHSRYSTNCTCIFDCTCTYFAIDIDSIMARLSLGRWVCCLAQLACGDDVCINLSFHGAAVDLATRSMRKCFQPCPAIDMASFLHETASNTVLLSIRHHFQYLTASNTALLSIRHPFPHETASTTALLLVGAEPFRTTILTDHNIQPPAELPSQSSGGCMSLINPICCSDGICRLEKS